MSEKRSFSYEFVNRRSQLKDVYATFLANFFQLGNRSSYPMLSQEFGSGKTSFADNLFNFDSAHIRQVFTEFAKSRNLGETAVPSYVPGHELFQGRSVKDYFESMLTVSIRLDSPEFRNIPGDARSRIPYMMWIAALKQLYKVSEDAFREFWGNVQGMTMCSNVLESYKELVKLTGAPIFFYFDEMQLLEYLPLEYFVNDFKLPVSDSSGLDKHKLFMWELSFALRHGVCLMAVGKSRVIYEIDVGRVVASPCYRKQVLLPLFSCADIKDVLKSKTSLKGASVYATLGLGSSAPTPSSDSSSAATSDVSKESTEENELLKWIQALTGGIPLFCEDCVKLLDEENITISTFQHEKARLENDLRCIIDLKFSKSELLAQGNNEYFDAAIRLAVLGLKVQLQSEIYVQSTTVLIRTLVERFCLPVEEVSNTDLHIIVLPWFMQKRLVSEGFVDATVFNSPASYADKGRALEVFCADRLRSWGALSRFFPHKTLSEYWPWVRDTCLERITLSSPTIIEGACVDTAEAVEGMLLRMLGESGPTIYLPAKTSSSPDLFMLIPAENTYSTLACVQCKNWKDCTSFADFLNELLKLNNILSAIDTLANREDAGRNQFPRLPILFIFLCTGGLGGRNFEKFQNRVLDHNTSGLRIPQGVQAIALGKDQLDDLLGEENVQALRKMGQLETK